MLDNPFGNKVSRKYLDDITSSSGQLSGYSENADCFPVVEQVNTLASANSKDQTQVGAQLKNFYDEMDQLALH